MFGLLAPLLKAVVPSLISSALQKSQARADRSQALGDQSQQFVRLRDAAERAGFNPLTALRANPSGGMVNPTPALASNSFVANALNDGLQTMFNAPQRAADAERDALERALMRQELANAQMQGKAYAKAMAFGYEIPQANNYSGVDHAGSGSFLGSGNVGNSNGASSSVKPIDLFVPYRRRDGSIVYGPNPQISDFDQFASAGALDATARAKNAVSGGASFLRQFSMVPQEFSGPSLAPVRPRKRPSYQNDATTTWGAM